ncbi:MAG: hypothetical protein AB7G68_08520 [Nitrospiraceae bacterium]
MHPQTCSSIGLPYLLALLGTLLAGCNAGSPVADLSIDIAEDHVAMTLRQEISSDGLGPIGIAEFRDSRRETVFLGMKTGRWGFWDSCIFTVKGGNVGRATADALSHYFRKAGRQTAMVQNGEPVTPVLITGEIIEMRIDGTSGLVSTHLTAHIILLLTQENHITGQTLSVKLTGSDSRNVVWFDPEDAEAVLANSLTDAFQRWLSGTETEMHAKRGGQHNDPSGRP